jgi:inhibitor of cysteine peptidase
MKKSLIIGLVSILLLPILVIACDKAASTSSVPALNGGQEAKIIELTLDDFAAQNNIVKNIELIVPGSLIVSLGSNPTTGYSWGDAEIGDMAKVAEATRQFVEPTATTNGDAMIVGAPGKDVWTFDSKATGTTTIKFSYGQPWEGGDKDAFSLTINVTVK